jgi:hypothetical protein
VAGGVVAGGVVAGGVVAGGVVAGGVVAGDVDLFGVDDFFGVGDVDTDAFPVVGTTLVPGTPPPTGLTG